MHEFYYMFKQFIFRMIKNPSLQAIGIEVWQTLNKDPDNEELISELKLDLVTPIGAFCSYLLGKYNFCYFCIGFGLAF